jgi:hypothetical protein
MRWTRFADTASLAAAQIVSGISPPAPSLATPMRSAGGGFYVHVRILPAFDAWNTLRQFQLRDQHAST